MRTFVFGAGASVHAGYPLAIDLWSSIKNWVRASFTSGDFLWAVDLFSDEFAQSKSFELALTDLDERIDRILSKKRETREECADKATYVDCLRPRLMEIIPTYFDSLRSHSAEYYRAFAENILSSGDAVITFNYDLALDRELRQSGKWSLASGYGFPVEAVPLEDSACKLLKLHGSTNWLGQPFGGGLGFGQVSPIQSLGQHPIINPSCFEFLGYDKVSNKGFNFAAPQIPSLIMPTAKKKFYIESSTGREWKDFWDCLWSQAAEALNSSNEIHVIGYSIPNYDERARELLARKASGDPVVNVCCHAGTESVVESFRALGHVNVQPACANCFESWISCMSLAGLTGANETLERTADEGRAIREGNAVIARIHEEHPSFGDPD
jgi:hypothetical protein